MNIKIKGKEVELKYGFNSFNYMRELDMSIMQELDRKPFMVLDMVETLLMGAVNHNPKVKYNIYDVQDAIEDFMEEGSLPELLEYLMTILQDSNFFKSLQKTTKNQ